MLGIPEREHPPAPPLLGMAAAAQAVADAAIPAGARVALVSGTSVGGMDLTENFYRDFRTDKAKGRLRDVAGHDCADSTQRIARHCGIGGYTATVSTACSSAANAIVTGALLLGERHGRLCGGRGHGCPLPFHAQRLQLALGTRPGALPSVRRHASRAEPGRRGGLPRPHARKRQACAPTAAWRDMPMPTTPITRRPRRKRARAHTAPWPGRWRKAGCAAWIRINVHGTATPNNDLTEGTALRRLFGGQVPPFSSDERLHGACARRGGRHRGRIGGAGYHTRAALRQPRIRGADPGTRLHPVARTQEADVRSVLSNSFVRRQLLFVNLCQMKLYVNCIHRAPAAPRHQGS